MNIDNIHEAIGLLRLEVRNFKSSRNGKTFNWQCEVCGDGTTGRKARFGVTIKGGSAVCNCFNCGYANNFFAYLRSYHPHIYERFAIEDLKQSATKHFDHNDLFQQNIHDSDLLVLFYGDVKSSPNEWINKMKEMKISLSKKNFEKLYNIYMKTNIN